MSNGMVRDFVDRRLNGASAATVPAAIAAALAELFTFFGQPFSEGDARVYARVLSGAGGLVLQELLDEEPTTRVFLPKPVELAEDLGVVVARLIEKQKFEPCASCVASPGWVEIAEPGEPRFVLRRTKTLHFTPFTAEPYWRSEVVLDSDGQPVLDPLPPATRLVRCVCYEQWQRRLGLPTVERKTQLGAGRGDVTSVGALVTRFKRRFDADTQE